MESEMLACLLVVGLAIPSSAGALPRGTLRVAQGDNAVKFANKARVPFVKALHSATKAVPGKATWMAMENIDGGLFHMATVVREDRSRYVVTIDSGTGKVVAVDLDTKKKKEKDGKKEEADYGGSLPAQGGNEDDYAYQAKVTLDEAMAAAVKAHPGKFYEVYIYASAGKLYYGIEIALRGKKKLLKVDVDAGNGKIVNTTDM